MRRFVHSSSNSSVPSVRSFVQVIAAIVRHCMDQGESQKTTKSLNCNNTQPHSTLSKRARGYHVYHWEIVVP